MIHSLRLRLLMTFTVVIIVAVGAVYLFVRQTTGGEIRRWGERSDQARVVRVGAELYEYYQANNFLNDEFSYEEKSQLGAQYSGLIRQCETEIEKIYEVAAAKARQLAKDNKLEEARQVLAEARTKVDPGIRTKLTEVEQELGDGTL